MVPSIGELMRKAKEVQEKIARVQEELASRTVEATSGGGMVRVVANGKGELISVNIEREVVDPAEVEMLQDLILAAVNEVLRKAQEALATEMGKITGGFPIPGLEGNL